MSASKASTCNPRAFKSAVLYWTGSLAIILAAAAVMVATPRPAQATPAFAAKTGLPCGRCHAAPSGGALTSFGKAFQANGDKLPKGK